MSERNPSAFERTGDGGSGASPLKARTVTTSGLAATEEEETLRWEGLLLAALRLFRRDCRGPCRQAWEDACSYCRALHRPTCRRSPYRASGNVSCVRRAWAEELAEAYQEMRLAYLPMLDQDFPAYLRRIRAPSQRFEGLL